MFWFPFCLVIGTSVSRVQSPHRWGARSCSRGCLGWPGGSRGAATGTAAGSRRSARRRRGEQPAQQAWSYVTIMHCCSNISGNMSQPPQIYVAMCVNVLLQLQGELINFCVVSTHVTLGHKLDKATNIACKQIDILFKSLH